LIFGHKTGSLFRLRITLKSGDGGSAFCMNLFSKESFIFANLRQSLAQNRSHRHVIKIKASKTMSVAGVFKTKTTLRI
jgi:hypothetical protein